MPSQGAPLLKNYSKVWSRYSHGAPCWTIPASTFLSKLSLKIELSLDYGTLIQGTSNLFLIRIPLLGGKEIK